MAFEHHYPRFILSQLGKSEDSRNDGLVRFEFTKTHLGIEDVSSSHPRKPLSAKDVAGSENLYSEFDDTLENSLQSVESKMAKMFYHLVSAGDIRTDLLDTLVRYGILLEARHPRYAVEGFKEASAVIHGDFSVEQPVFGVLIAENTEMGGFVSEDRPWTTMGNVGPNTFWLGDFTYSRRLRITLYLVPDGQTKPGVVAFWNRIKFDRTSIYAHLLASIVEGKNVIYVNPQDYDAYDLLLRQNLNSSNRAMVSFLNSVSDRLHGQQTHSGEEKVYFREGNRLVSRDGWSQPNRSLVHQIKTPPFHGTYRVEGFEKRYYGMRESYYPYYDAAEGKTYGLDQNGQVVEVLSKQLPIPVTRIRRRTR